MLLLCVFYLLQYVNRGLELRTSTTFTRFVIELIYTVPHILIYDNVIYTLHINQQYILPYMLRY